MSADSRIEELLLRWEEFRDQGQSIAVEALCKDCPELLEPLRKRIQALRAVDSWLAPTQTPLQATTAADHTGAAGSPSRIDPEMDFDKVNIPGYEILGVLGRGGMGVVYKARQISLARTVALKMILREANVGGQELGRFLAEAEAVARLQHPNIVAIYEVGMADRRPFFSMEFVGGGNLDDMLRGAPQPAHFAAELIEQLARALHFSHELGIVHRDLKPSNILLQDNHGGKQTKNTSFSFIPKITDFGLAKRLDIEQRFTRTGMIMGTPSYMAPEQAAGQTHDIGRAVDIYALGAILYEVLTGRPPLLGATSIETIQRVRSVEPISPRTLQPMLPRDIETICLKCLQKNQSRRYATAEELADDLRRFLDHQPIMARPTPAWEKLLKWARRRPALASLLSVGVAATIVLLSVGAWFNVRLSAKNIELTAEKQNVDKQLVKLHVANGLRSLDEGDYYEALLWLAEALQLEHDAAKLSAHHMRLSAVLRHCPTIVQIAFHESAINQAVFSPDGRQFATASADHSARIWDVDSGRSLEPILTHDGPINGISFSRDGQWIVTAGADYQAKLWKLSTRKLHATLKHDGPVVRAVFNRNSSMIVTASADKTVGVWEITSAGAVERLKLYHAQAVTDAAFDPRGTRIVTGCADGTARVWDAKTGLALGAPLTHAQAVTSAAFSSDGRIIATASQDGTAKTWTWKPEDQRFVASNTLVHQGAVLRAAFSPDGRRIVTASTDLTARIWDAMTGRQITRTLRHGSAVTWADFSPKGDWVVTASDDDAARVWDVASGKPVSPMLYHGGTVRHVVFDPDGRRILTASDDDTARIYDVAPREPAVPDLRHQGPVLRASYSRDGTRLATASADRTCRIWDAKRGTQVAPDFQHDGPVVDVCFGTDGQWVLTASSDGTARVWNVRTGQMRIGSRFQHPGPVLAASFSPDNRRIVTACADGKARIWNAISDLTPEYILPHEQTVRAAGFNSHGDLVVTASDDATARVWSVSDGKPVSGALRHQAAVGSARFDRDGRRVITASKDKTARIWTATSDVSIGRPLSHAGIVLDASFDEKGDYCVTASDDDTAQIWQVSNGGRVKPPLRHAGAIAHARFSHNGAWVVTVSDDNTARIWDVEEGEALTPALTHSGWGRLTDSEFCPTRPCVATASADGTVRLWDLSTQNRMPEHLLLLAQLYAGSRIDEITRGLVPIDSNELQKIWQQVRRTNSTKE